MDFFKQQAASFLDSQKDDEPHKKKPAASESEDYSSSAGGYGGEPTKHNYGGEQGSEPTEHNYGGEQGSEPTKHKYGAGEQEHNYGGEPTKQGHKKAQDDDVPSYQELMSSASVLMEAAKGKFGGGGGTGEGKDQHGKKADTDPAKLAAAAQDLIDAAQHYGKLDDSSPMGAYLKKAEGYLQSYQKNPREAEAAVRDVSATRRDSDDSEERRY